MLVWHFFCAIIAATISLDIFVITNYIIESNCEIKMLSNFLILLIFFNCFDFFECNTFGFCSISQILFFFLFFILSLYNSSHICF